MTKPPRTHEALLLTGTGLGVAAALGFYVCTTQIPYIGWVVGVMAAAGLGFCLRDARQRDAQGEAATTDYRPTPGKVTVFNQEYKERV